MNGQTYIDLILKPHYIPFYHEMVRKYGPGVMFQEDGARYHHSKMVQAVKKAAGMKIFPHPPCSPDLTHIENRWRTVKITVGKKRHGIKNLEAMEEEVTLGWNNTPKEVMQKLVDSMPRRYRECIANKGGHTHY